MSLNPITNIGVTYVRWGRDTCPDVAGTQLIYAGRAGGTFWSIQGGAVEKLCMPEDPVYLNDTAGLDATIESSPFVHGAEYEFIDGPNSNLQHHNVPCAVCYASTRQTTIMIPARTECPPTWTREYYGYLTAERASHRRSSYTCVDSNPEAIGGIDTSANNNGALFYYVLSACNTNGLTCPPYVHGSALSCVICSK